MKGYNPIELAERLRPKMIDLENQWKAIQIWKEELQKRYTHEELSLKPHEVPVRRRRVE